MNIKRNLSKLVRVSLREAWKHEANDFTPWLAETENLNILAESVGLSELNLVATEHWVGDFKVDILCTDGVDQVIIENQLEKTNHSHLGQIITYAAGIGAKKVIWIAESFRPEHQSALEFLNQNTTEDLSFFAVEVELWRIGESPMAPKFEVVVRPNEWVKAGKEQARAASVTTPTKNLNLRLWQKVEEKIKARYSDLKIHKPQAQNWITSSIGHSGFGLNLTASFQNQRLGVEIYIQCADAKLLFRKILEQKVEIENKLGFTVEWQELPNAQASRIVVYRRDCPLEDESRWDDYVDWFISHMRIMKSVFQPVIKNIR
jgi:hypothetical protein